MHGTTAGEVGKILVHATDVAVARLRRKLQLRGGILGGEGIEERRFDQNLRRARRDFGILAAHHARDGRRLLRVADEKHLLVQLALLPVERLHRLVCPRRTHHNLASRQLGVVERVERLPQLQHHIVRDIHEKPERTHAAGLKALRHERRRRAVLDGCDHARRVAGALLEILDLDGHFVPDVRLRFGEIHRRHLERATEDGGVFPRQPYDGERVRTVPGDLDVKHRLGLFAR